MIKRLLTAALLLSGAAFAQAPSCSSATVPVCSLGSPNGDTQSKPVATPTSTTTVASSDAYLTYIELTNTTGSPISFTLADKQGSPVVSLSAVPIPANSTTIVIYQDKGRWCPGGFTIVASGAGLNFYGRWKQ